MSEVKVAVEEVVTETKEVVTEIKEVVIETKEVLGEFDSQEAGDSKLIASETQADDTNQIVDEKIDVKMQQPTIVIVHASAIIENYPGEMLTEKEASNVRNLVFSAKHLEENVVKFEFGKTFCSKTGNGKFRHTVEIKLFVAAHKLWEAPRSYIWKHLGRSEWTDRNGSTLVFKRIHVKT